MNQEANFILIKDGKLYDPQKQGTKDILIGADKIIKIDENIDLPKDLEADIIDVPGNLIGLAKGEVTTLHRTLAGLVKLGTLSLPQALSLITTNPAKRLGVFDQKGHLVAGKDADLLILNENLEIEKVYAKGKLMIDGGRAVVKGVFE